MRCVVQCLMAKMRKGKRGRRCVVHCLGRDGPVRVGCCVARLAMPRSLLGDGVDKVGVGVQGGGLSITAVAGGKVEGVGEEGE